MEAFTPWDDKVSGINPFVPCQQKKATSTIAWLLNNAFAASLLLLKMPILLISMALFLVSLFLFHTSYFGILKRIVYTLLLSPSTKLILFTLGVRTQGKYADTRKLRLRTRNSSNSSEVKRISSKHRMYGHGVKSGDVILSNYTNFTEILYIIAQFTPVFASVSDDGSVDRINPLKALIRSITLDSMRSTTTTSNSNGDRGSSDKNSLANILKSSYFPVVIFPEGVQTNGKGLLHFLSIFKGYAERSEHHTLVLPSIHLLGFRYPTFSPLPHTAGSWLTQTCKVLRQFAIKREAVFLGDIDVKLLVGACEVTNPTKYSEGKHGSKQYSNTCSSKQKNAELIVINEDEGQLMDELRSLMGSMIGIKLVDLGVNDFFDFFEFFESHRIKTKERGTSSSSNIIGRGVNNRNRKRKPL